MEIDSPPLVIHNVHFIWDDLNTPYTITIENGLISAIYPTPPPPAHVPYATNINGNHGTVLPSFCQPHIHLDNPYLIHRGPPMVCGSFCEALELTNFSRQEYTEEDLIERGRRLIMENVQVGVTSMRCHVEVDEMVGLKCLEAGLKLKKEFGDEGRGICDIQIAVFAQEAVFIGEDNGVAMRKLFFEACEREGVDAIGSTPYVETTVALAKKNIDWIIDIAMLNKKHLDLHLDHNLSLRNEPLIYHLIHTLKSRSWSTSMPSHLRITLGHCTRLSLFPPYELRQLHELISTDNLPIHFVGVPAVDLYFMGRGPTDGPATGGGATERGTLPVIDWIRNYDFDVALGVGNVGNAFTPMGGVDPLGMAAWLGTVYQGGSQADCRVLLECITTRAKEAIGVMQNQYKDDDRMAISVGDQADLVIVGQRSRDMGVHELFVEPGYGRIVIKGGKIVAKRAVETWIA
ncbi:Metallo-dependent hydrolase [Morchella conica CCBAS932]|uniref:Metallo-dependent hydrolase n=1 Tax=Morchella conica CCBAS932 TaxID=1392247 RepID=A0A3N4KJY7_9PEZI|nr:Metallo-dependent hydrolase [Morchella conica CCBAS932]